MTHRMYKLGLLALVSSVLYFFPACTRKPEAQPLNTDQRRQLEERMQQLQAEEIKQVESLKRANKEKGK